MFGKRSLVVLGAVLALVMATLALGTASAGSINEFVSGNFTDTSIDTNDDGIQANLISGAARGGGNPTYEGLWEIAFAPTGLCADGEVEGTVVAYSVVRRYKNGDLLFSSLDSGSLCFNPGTGLALLTVYANIDGGTGKYAGASGSYSAEYAVNLLLPDLTGGILHGAFHGRVSGTVN